MTHNAAFFQRACGRPLSLLPLALLAGTAMAHPGHDEAHAMGFWEGLAHLLTQPDHLVMLAAAVGIGVAGARAWRSSRRADRRPTDGRPF